jgi:hypothetical protein
MHATQRPPRGDNRYRVHRSVKCYLARLTCGSVSCTWSFSSSIERVVYLLPGSGEHVQFRNSLIRLQSADRMSELVQDHLVAGGSVEVGGVLLVPGNLTKFSPYPYVDVSSREERDAYSRLYRQSPQA